MYSSEVLSSIVKQQEELSSSVEKQKEREINKVIKKIKDYEDADRSVHLTFNVLALILLVAGFMFWAYCFYSVGWTNLENFRRVGGIIVPLFGLSFLLFLTSHSFLKIRNLSILPYFKELFINVCSKPYEFRIEYVKNEKGNIDRNKAKIIIEKNVLVDNSHVIKEKSEHITAYLDLTQSKDSLIYMIHTLAKKAEEKF